MPKYWVKQIFSLGRFPEVGQKQSTEKKKREVGNNNGQIRIATPPRVAHAKPPGSKREKRDRKLVITMASYALQRHHGWRTESHLGQL